MASYKVSVLRDDALLTCCDQAPVDVDSLIGLYQSEGYDVRCIDSAGLSDPAVLNTALCDLVFLPYGPKFPVTAYDNFRSFASNGGKIITTGGYAFRDMVSDGSFVPDDKNYCIAVSSDKVACAAWQKELPASRFTNQGRCVLKFWLRTEDIEGPGYAYASLQFFRKGKMILEVVPEKCQVRDQDFTYVHHWFDTPAEADRVIFCSGMRHMRGKVCLDDLQITYSPYLEVYTDGFNDPGALDTGLWDVDIQRYPHGWRKVTDYDGAQFTHELRQKWYYLNSAVSDRVGDGAFYRRTAMPVFDLENTLEDVAYVSPAEDQVVFGDLGFSGGVTGWSAVAFVSDKHARWQPLINAYSSTGKIRGVVGGLVRSYIDMPAEDSGNLKSETGWMDYPGSAIGFFGATDVDLFAPGNQALREGLLELSQVMLGNAYIAHIENRYDNYKAGEKPRVKVKYANAGREAFAGAVTVEFIDDASGEVVDTQTKSIVLAAGMVEEAGFTWDATEFGTDFYRVTAYLTGRGGKKIDKISTGFSIWDIGVLKTGPSFTVRDNYYYVKSDDGKVEKAVYASGCDEWMGLLDHKQITPLWLKRSMIGRRDQGLYVYECLDNVGRFPDAGATAEELEIHEKHMRKQDNAAFLAQKYNQIYMMGMAIGDNVACDDATLLKTCEGITTLASRYVNVPGMIYYLNGDFRCQFTKEASAHVRPMWNEFLKGRYPNTAALRASWGDDSVTLGDVDIAEYPMEGNGWKDGKALDMNMFRIYLMNRWVEALYKAVRKVDAIHPVTSEYYECPMMAVDVPLAIGSQEIANIGCFSDFREFAQRVAAIDQRYRGKGLGIGEFGIRTHPMFRYCEVEYARGFPYQTVMDTFTHVFNTTFALGANHNNIWCWADSASHNFPWGMMFNDESPRDLYYWMRNGNLFLRQLEPKYMSPEVALILPDTTRLSGSEGQLGGHFAAVNALNVLHHTGIGEIATLNDSDLRIAPEIKVLFYPLSCNPTDEVYCKLLSWVKDGGVLYLSGDITYDAERKRTRAARLNEIAGVSFNSDNYVGTDYHATDKIFYTSVYKPHLKKQGCPAIDVSLAGAQAIFNDGAGNPVMTEYALGCGKVIYSTVPAEVFFSNPTLKEDIAFYQYVLSQADVTAIDVKSDIIDMRILRQPLADGGKLYNIGNISEMSSKVLFAERYEFDCGAYKNNLIWENGKGELAGLFVQGLFKDNDQVITQNDPYAYIYAKDGGALIGSRRIVVLPQQSGMLRLKLDAAFEELAVLAGEVVGMRWVTGEKLRANAIDGYVEFAVTHANRNAIILIGDAADMDCFGDMVAKTMSEKIPPEYEKSYCG